jgi:hypothetical protein
MINPFTHRKILKKGMPGRATIVASSVPARGATSFNMAMTLQVHVEGITPYEVEDQWMVKSKDTEALGGSIPVKVDREEHEKVAIDWGLLREEHSRAVQERRDALASGASQFEAAQAQPMQGATPVIDMQNDPELRAKIEKVLGRKLTPGTTETIGENDPALQMQIMQVVQQHMAEKGAGTQAPEPGGGGDDTALELERLAGLRNSGALSEEEFEQAKRKILE